MLSEVAAFLAHMGSAHGGFTYRTSDGTFPRNGFAVSVAKDLERSWDGPLLAQHVTEFYAANAQLIEAANVVFSGGACVGAWQDGGRWYLDLSIVVRSLDEALVLGRHNKQLAVYDLADQVSIAIPYHDEVAA